MECLVFVKNTKSVANDNVTSLVAYQGNALAAHTAGHVTTVRGANITAQMDNAGGTVGTAYGGSFNVSQTTDSDKVVPTVYGVYAKVDTGANAAGGKFTTSEGVRAEIEMQQDVTMTTARAFHALLDVDDGIITNGYQFYGQTTLAAGAEITNHYGIYTTGCDLNRLGGTLQITNIPEIGSDTDKFIMSDGQILKYVTGDNLRSYIGAGTGTVTISGTPVAKEFAEWTDATTIKGSDTLAVNSSTDGINILGNDSVGTAVSILRLLRNNAVADDRFQFIIGSSTENYIYSGNSTDTHSLVFGLLDANNSNIEQVLKLKRGSGVQIPVCNEIGSDTDKFLMVSGTDNLIEYVTGDNLLSYIGGAPSSGGAYLPLVGGTMSGNIAMGDNDITGIDELKFNSGTKLGDGGGTDWVDLTYANSGDGGLRVKDINDQVQGYLYGTGGVTSDFGLLTGAGEWAVRTIENGLVELRHDNAVKLQTTNTGISVTGTLTVGSSGSSRFTDTSSFPLQLNRGLAVDVHGTNGVHLGLGSYTTGTTYVDAARIAANLEYNGTTASGDLFLQVNNSGTYSNALTINNDTNATFAGDLTVSDELTVSTISNATADPDKFLCANGNGKVGYRTGAQVLSDIGAGTVSGNGTSGRVAFWSGSSVITSDSDLTFNGSSLTVGGTISSTQGNYQSNAEVVMSNSSSQSTLNIGDAEETDGISLIRLKTAGSTQMTVDDGSVDLNTNVDFQVQGGDIRLLGDANINLDVSLSTGNTSGIILPIGSGSVVGGKFYYFAGLSWSQTDADNESSSKGLIAYAKSSGTPSTNRMLVSGIIYKASHGFILGSPLYLSTNPGDLQTTAPSGANDVARVVGYALDANHIFFRPDNTWVKIS